MNRLGEDIQVIVQTEQRSGHYRCEGFSGFPVVNPCFVVIATARTPIALDWAEELRKELALSVAGLSQGFASVVAMAVPCGGRISDMFECHAHRVAAAQKLLILVGDPSSPFLSCSAFEQWDALGSSYHVLPVFPVGSAVAKLLPSPTLRLRNAVFWQNSITEVVSEVFAALGLTAQEHRLFVSYYRPDTQPLADQLFDELSHQRFDVYVDRFRTPPAVDFRVRIEQELADKAMMLVLESPNIMSSKWCLHEINFAKLRRLGLLALNLPRVAFVPGIDSRIRVRLTPSDFMNPVACDVLTNSALQRVVTQVKDEHGRALIYRRQFIRNAMRMALRLNGVRNPALGADGLIRMQSLKGSQQYAFWLTTRSPDLSDFHKTDINCAAGEKGVIVGPGVVEVTRRDRLEWLSTKSTVRYKDEGYILSVAQDAAEGRL